MIRKFLVLSLFVLLFSVACEQLQTPVAPTDPSVAAEECVMPESDNRYSWAHNSCVDVTTTVYTVFVLVDDEVVSHTEIGASGSAIYTSGIGLASYRMWQDGKGLLPVKIIDIDPNIAGIPVGSSIVLKTSDLKAMGLPPGVITQFICNLDTEVLSPVQHMQVLTSDRLTYELDDCRMSWPTFSRTTEPASPESTEEEDN